MANREEITNKIIDIAKKYASQNKSIKLDTELKRDLGINGDDAEELILEIIDEFDIDSETLDIKLKNHFNSEAIVPFVIILSKLFPGYKCKKIPIKICHLVFFVENRVWPIKYDT